MRVKKFKTNHINGAANLERLQNYLAGVDGVKAVRIDSQADTVTVEYDEKYTSEENLIAQIHQSGAELQ